MPVLTIVVPHTSRATADSRFKRIRWPGIEVFRARS
jgi:hypothetical protein